MGEVYRARDSNLGRDVAIKILPQIFLDDPDRQARFEREARVLASEVFLENYPKSSGRWPVSSAGGIQPKWHPDDNELFYLGLDGRLMAVPLALGALPEIGRPQPLFQTGVEAITGFTWHQYDVTRDGQRFLVNVAQPVNVPVTVLLNWPAASGPRR
jgi:hypothetical protein